MKRRRQMDKQKLASMIEHTILKSSASSSEVAQLCNEAKIGTSSGMAIIKGLEAEAGSY